MKLFTAKITIFLIIAYCELCFGWTDGAWDTGKSTKYLDNEGAKFYSNSDNDAWISNLPIEVQGLNSYIAFGDNESAKIMWDESGNDQLVIGLDLNSATGSGFLSIMENTDLGNTNRQPATTNHPTLRLYSKDETRSSDYMDIYFDDIANKGLIITQSGYLHLAPSGGQIIFGDASDLTKTPCLIKPDLTAQQIVLYVNTDGGKQIVLADSAWTDYSHPPQTNPTLYIQSDINTNIEEYMSLSHNQTDGIIATGDGNINLNPDSNIVRINNVLKIIERSSDPSEPSEGETIIWMSDGTGKGDDGDVIIAVKANGVTRYGTLFDHSSGTSW